MNKILVSVEKECLSFSKYNRAIADENLNNTNIIDVKSLKFSEEYILENIELVSTFINLITLKFNINKIIIKKLDIAETVIELIQNLSNIKYINFKEDKELSYTISSLLLENNNLEKIECYSLPLIMFHKFNKNQIETRNKILSTSEFLKINKIDTYSDLFNKDKIIVECIKQDDLQAIYYFFNNNKNLKKIELKKYDRKNLNGFLHLIKQNNLKNISIIIHESEETTKEILNDINLFEKLNKQYKVNIKVKYSKKYKVKNRIKELNVIMLRNIFVVLILVGIFLFVAYKFLDFKHYKSIESNIKEINDVVKKEEEKNNVDVDYIGEDIEDSYSNQKYYDSAYNKKYSKAYKELLKINEETIGWLIINNTNINYPVVQTTNNDYYLDHAYDKTENIAGWIYVDYRNNLDLMDKNTIIYGHSGLKSNVMFSSLNNVLNENWYTNENNLRIYFSIKGKQYIFNIFSIYVVDVTSDYLDINFNTAEDYINFIKMIKGRSINDFNVEVTANDKILTLSTCYKDSSRRLVVHAKMN